MADVFFRSDFYYKKWFILAKMDSGSSETDSFEVRIGTECTVPTQNSYTSSNDGWTEVQTCAELNGWEFFSTTILAWLFLRIQHKELHSTRHISCQ